MNIRGIILAGGNGERLKPLTNLTPKALLPVGDKPMVAYQIQKMQEIGITEIAIVRQGSFDSAFRKAIGNTSLNISYVDHPNISKGMPYAIALAKFCDDRQSAICVLCADVLFDDSLEIARHAFEADPQRAVIIAGETDDTAGFSPIKSVNDNVVSILPKDASRHEPGIVDLGAGLYPSDVFEKAQSLYPSETEVPITKLNNMYLSESRLRATTLRGYWVDAGSSIEVYNSVVMKYVKSS